jgi:hypothetical protein
MLEAKAEAQAEDKAMAQDSLLIHLLQVQWKLWKLKTLQVWATKTSKKFLLLTVSQPEERLMK